MLPTSKPTTLPTSQSTGQPSSLPNSLPTGKPMDHPTMQPTCLPTSLRQTSLPVNLRHCRPINLLVCSQVSRKYNLPVYWPNSLLIILQDSLIWYYFISLLITYTYCYSTVIVLSLSNNVCHFRNPWVSVYTRCFDDTNAFNTTWDLRIIGWRLDFLSLPVW